MKMTKISHTKALCRTCSDQYLIIFYRDKKIQKLCNVMGLKMAHDPDETYELTTDNVKKILAIYMRFR